MRVAGERVGAVNWASRELAEKKRQRLISGLYHSLQCNPTVLPVQGIWTSFSTPSAGVQQLGEVTRQLGFGGRVVWGISQVVLPRVWPLT